MRNRVAVLVTVGLFATLLGASAEPSFLRIENQFGHAHALLYMPQKASTIAVLQVHPWANSFDSFLGPLLSEKGFAVLLLNTRGVNKEGGQPNEIFETLLLDVATGMEELRRRGYTEIILAGSSAGGPLISLYENAAENGNRVFAGERKVFSFPGFFDKNGQALRLPSARALILMNPICGAATTFLNRLDPAVADESSGKRDSSLDMFDPANDFDAKSGLATYSEEFRRRFGKAQAARMNRLIDTARAKLANGTMGYSDDDLIIIRSTRARLLYADMGLGHGHFPALILPGGRIDVPRSDRTPGHYSLFGAVGDRNASVEGVVVHTLRSFLSMRAVRASFIDPTATCLADWGVDIESTNTTTVGNLRQIGAPWVLFSGTADDKINIAELIYKETRSPDRSLIFIQGATHQMTSVDSSKLSTAALRSLLVEQIAKWIGARFRSR